MLQNSFNFKLGHQVEVDKIVLAKLEQESKQLSICSSTGGGKISIYNQSQQNQNLNINKEIKLVKAIRSEDSDIILLVSQNALLAYDVLKNQEIFHREFDDGINFLEFGEFYYNELVQNLIFIGGNCSIQGIDLIGEDVYWNISSDLVIALKLLDTNELIVSNEDQLIQVYKEENITHEIPEEAQCQIISQINKKHYCLGFQNGGISVYSTQNHTKKWKSKGSGSINNILKCQNKTFIVVRNNGKIEFRNENSGEIVSKQQLPENIIYSAIENYFVNNTDQQYVFFYKDGSVQGYLYQTGVNQANIQNDIQQLKQQYDQLLLQREQNQQNQKNTNALIQQEVRIKYTFVAQDNSIFLMLQSSKNTFIKGTILQSNNFFPEQTYYSNPNIKQNPLIKLDIQNYQGDKLNLQCCVSPNIVSLIFQIERFTIQVPKFVNLQIADVETPDGYVQFTIYENASRYIIWLRQSFNITQDQLASVENNKTIQIQFIDVKDGQPLEIKVDSRTSQVYLYSENIQLCSDIVQDLCDYMGINELDSQGEFPKENQKVRDLLGQVEKLKKTRVQISSDIADSINIVKMGVVKAEDSLIMHNTQMMKKYYQDCMAENNSLKIELLKRQNNNTILMDSLKEINQIIQKSGNLRLGVYKQQMVQLARQALKENNTNGLINVINTNKQY